MSRDLTKMVEKFKKQCPLAEHTFLILEAMAAEIEANREQIEAGNTARSILWGDIKANRKEIEKLKHKTKYMR